jgi:transposase InsO family protein
MEGYFDGFHCWIATDNKETRLNFCGSRHSNEEWSFIPMRTMHQAPDIARVFISEIVSLHGVPKRIVSDRGSVFTGQFWTSFQEALGTQLNFSTAYHSETDRKNEQTNQTLEDMLRMYVMDQQKHWEEFLPLVEFAYNNQLPKHH